MDRRDREGEENREKTVPTWLWRVWKRAIEVEIKLASASLVSMQKKGKACVCVCAALRLKPARLLASLLLSDSLSSTMNHCCSAHYYVASFSLSPACCRIHAVYRSIVVLMPFFFVLPSLTRLPSSTGERLCSASQVACARLVFSFSSMHTHSAIDRLDAVCVCVCVCARIDDAQRRNAGDDNNAGAHTYRVYRFYH